jgi:uncharacterized protein (DUF433 family)
LENTVTQHIVRTPGTLGGSPHIAGHRVRVMDIVVWHEKRSFSPDQIVDLFPGITLADVHAALAYYFDHTDEIEAEFSREAKTIAETQPQYPSKTQKKLGD